MKKAFLLLSALLAFTISFAQIGSMSGYGNADINSINKLRPAGIRSFLLNFDWGKLETSPDVWDWTDFDNQMLTAKVNNLKVIVIVYTGYAAPGYLYANGVPKVTTTSNTFPYYPYYFNAYYKVRFKNMIAQVVSHIKNASYAGNILMVHSAEGPTADDAPYKGEAINNAYAITEAQWEPWKHEVWQYLDSNLSLIPGRPIRIMVNQSNDGKNFLYAVRNLYKPGLKYGNFSHNVFFPGDWYGAQRLNGLDTTTDLTAYISRGEFQVIYNQPWWKYYPKAMTWRMSISAVDGGLKLLNIGTGTLGAVNNDLTVYDEFNEFASLRKVETADRAFIVLGNPVNLTDTVQYSKGTYGNLIAAGDLATYNNKYLTQVVNNTDDSLDKRQYLATKLMVDYFNPSRRALIMALYPDAGYVPLEMGNDNNTWNGNANIYSRNNYGKFITQSNYTQSKLVFKRGMNVNSKFGFMCRTFDSAHNTMLFDIDDNFDLSGGVIVEVTYLDSSNGRWRLIYNNGKKARDRITCLNTGEWKTAIFTIQGFAANGLTSGDDFGIEYARNASTVFQMIKVKKVKAFTP